MECCKRPHSITPSSLQTMPHTLWHSRSKCSIWIAPVAPQLLPIPHLSRGCSTTSLLLHSARQSINCSPGLLALILPHLFPIFCEPTLLENPLHPR